MIEKFKTSLFGYAKREVCEYISKASDELTKKHNAEKKTLEEKIQELQEENNRLLQSEKDMIKKLETLEIEKKQAFDETAQVSALLIDARRFADELKNKALEQNRLEIEENSRRHAQVAEKINKCNNEVDSIRNYLQKFLENTDRELTEIKNKLDGVDIS